MVKGHLVNFQKKITVIKLTALFLALGLMFLVPTLHARGNTVQQDCVMESDRLLQTALDNDSVKIIIKLEVANLQTLTAESSQYQVVRPGESFPAIGYQADLNLKQAIGSAANGVLQQLNGTWYSVKYIYSFTPYLALEVSPEALSILQTLPEVLDIREDTLDLLIDPNMGEQENSSSTAGTAGIAKPMLQNTVNIIGASDTWAMGFTGDDWYVAILDTGIRPTHDFFAGKDIKEHCFSYLHHCPNGQAEMDGRGSAAHHPSSYWGWDHGTHVTGIAAGNNGTLFGVAKDADVIAVQVFSRIDQDCYPSIPGYQPCVGSYQSDQESALEYIYSLRTTYPISSANMSLGGGQYSSPCDSDSRKAKIDLLRAVGISTAIATGNNGWCGYIGAPACISTSIAVGATYDWDVECSFNNWHPTMLKLFAPGDNVYSSTGDSDSSYQSWDGTSMSTPHVTGAWALVKQAWPEGPVGDIFDAFESTGVEITTKCGTGDTRPRIQVDEALLSLQDITVTSPAGGESFAIGETITIEWTTRAITGDVQIILRSRDLDPDSWSNEPLRYVIEDAYPHDGSPYNWTIPNSIRPGKYLIEVRQDDVFGQSGDFKIYIPPSITVTQPRGGELFRLGDTMRIVWQTQGITGNVTILMESADPAFFTVYTIERSYPHDGSPYYWVIPDYVHPGMYVIKIQQGTVYGRSGIFEVLSP
jgi:subtilisin family serine protease